MEVEHLVRWWKAHLGPQMQLGSAHISVKNLENNPKTGETNSTTKGREEATMNRVGRVEMWSEPNEPWQSLERRESWMWRGERKTITQGNLYGEDELP